MTCEYCRRSGDGTQCLGCGAPLTQEKKKPKSSASYHCCHCGKKYVEQWNGSYSVVHGGRIMEKVASCTCTTERRAAERQREMAEAYQTLFYCVVILSPLLLTAAFSIARTILTGH